MKGFNAADYIFKKNCEEILNWGTDTNEETVRAKWEDGTPAYTKKVFGIVNDYNLALGEFPALSLRKTNIKAAFDEILWIYQRNSNNVKDLGSHIWDSWTDENGSIGKAYGYQVGKESWYNDTESFMNQIDRVLYDLKYNPFSRRIMVNMYNPEDLHEMRLYPCAHSITLNVTKDPLVGKMVLNMILNQRSQDMLVANNWNVCQYCLLLMMLAQVNDMLPGRFVHVISDAHIYDRHIPMVQELIGRDSYKPPKVWLNPEVKNFYQFRVDDLHVEGYEYGESLGKIPVAV